jgi:N-acetylmuramic acid 6-phosphate etherase
MISTGVGYAVASGYLRTAGGHVKTAIVMIRTGADAAGANRRLRAAGGFVHRAIASGVPR